MIEFLSAGTLLGLAAGFAPGPLLVLVISETLRHNIKAGIKVSIAPLITDVPIILISLSPSIRKCDDVFTHSGLSAE
jgi:threonine/homoserine/homoserine lactone efflux protein